LELREAMHQGEGFVLVEPLEHVVGFHQVHKIENISIHSRGVECQFKQVKQHMRSCAEAPFSRLA
jgi:hypothetical protein